MYWSLCLEVATCTEEFYWKMSASGGNFNHDSEDFLKSLLFFKTLANKTLS